MLLDALYLDFIRVRRVSMPCAVTEKVAAHFPVSVCLESREKARTSKMRNGEILFHPRSREVNVRESFPLLSLIVVALGRSAMDQIRLRSPWSKMCHKSYGNFRAPGYIYTRFVEIVMNLRLTILSRGPAQRAPSLDFSSVHHILQWSPL